MTVPLPWQRGQGTRDANGPWFWASTPRPWHSGQILGEVPGAAPEPWQVGQGPLLSTGTRTDGALERLVERDRDVGLQVGAALGAAAAAAAPPLGGAAEEVRQDVAEVAHLEGLAALAEHVRVEALKAALPAAGPVRGSKAPRRSISSYCLRFSGSDSVS